MEIDLLDKELLKKDLPKNEYFNVDKAKLYCSFIDFLIILMPDMEITEFKATHDVGFKFELFSIANTYLISLTGYMDENKNLTSLQNLGVYAKNNERILFLSEYDLLSLPYDHKFDSEVETMIKNSPLVTTYIEDLLAKEENPDEYYTKDKLLKYHVKIWDPADDDNTIFDDYIESYSDEEVVEFCKDHFTSSNCHYFIYSNEEWDPILINLLEHLRKIGCIWSYYISYDFSWNGDDNDKSYIEIRPYHGCEDNKSVYIHSNEGLRSYLSSKVWHYFSRRSIIRNIKEGYVEALNLTYEHELKRRKGQEWA